ncbi:MAG TPA: hypothetical protein VK325_01745 [Pseudoxanthomonas sp.]|nr:hypothetical protein [Pseudoxanthomonas sp.]
MSWLTVWVWLAASWYVLWAKSTVTMAFRSSPAAAPLGRKPAAGKATMPACLS